MGGTLQSVAFYAGGFLVIVNAGYQWGDFVGWFVVGLFLLFVALLHTIARVATALEKLVRMADEARKRT